MGKKPDERYAMLRQAGLVTLIPFLLLVSPVVGYYIGRFLDKRFHTSFLWIAFLVLGFVAGAREVYRVIVRVGRETESGDQ
ncbi:MAG: AtpZ/AtpI family protein [Candidatus Eisenbacteria bacterium]|nr:AtpZ/AtpI family protein [Candidatus Eisenbacteria bacterium]